MVKPLTFKGDKRPKKRKRTEAEIASSDAGPSHLAATRFPTDEDDDNTWVSAEAIDDVGGPVMLVLPTEPPTCLACDANGKVFTDIIENTIDGSPASAEPHDVRQVWVANKIYGTDNFRFKGRHGKYLACDKHGILSATSEAIAPPETWNIIAAPETLEAFQLQTLQQTFLTVTMPKKPGGAPEVRGDATEAGSESTLRIRMQARFKPRLKASKELKEKARVSRKELEEAAGRRLDEEEVKKLKKARREGDYHEQLLDLKSKNKHDKYG
ncbi:actin-crosslinking protein [Xylaria sp. CBS 124048]|nr:actin-crosslinking protein [Xylaria sp. CBS 124048]